jgi:hypothetical protein
MNTMSLFGIIFVLRVDCQVCRRKTGLIGSMLSGRFVGWLVSCDGSGLHRWIN